MKCFNIFLILKYPTLQLLNKYFCIQILRELSFFKQFRNLKNCLQSCKKLLSNIHVYHMLLSTPKQYLLLDLFVVVHNNCSVGKTFCLFYEFKAERTFIYCMKKILYQSYYFAGFDVLTSFKIKFWNLARLHEEQSNDCNFCVVPDMCWLGTCTGGTPLLIF